MGAAKAGPAAVAAQMKQKAKMLAKKMQAKLETQAADKAREVKGKKQKIQKTAARLQSKCMQPKTKECSGKLQDERKKLSSKGPLISKQANRKLLSRHKKCLHVAEWECKKKTTMAMLHKLDAKETKLAKLEHSLIPWRKEQARKKKQAEAKRRKEKQEKTKKRQAAMAKKLKVKLAKQRKQLSADQKKMKEDKKKRK